MEVGKIDRRRRYTLAVIREAFFELLAEVGFAKMTVADICRRAEINRGTFYLHYEDKFALLDALIDEALAAAPPLEGTEAGALCQRPPANDDYYLLYSDDDAYARVAQHVIERGAAQMVPSIMEKTGLSREDAYLLFVHNVQGNLAVNRLLGWRRGLSSLTPRSCLVPIPKGAYGRFPLFVVLMIRPALWGKTKAQRPDFEVFFVTALAFVPGTGEESLCLFCMTLAGMRGSFASADLRRGPTGGASLAPCALIAN